MPSPTRDFLSYVASEAITALIDAVSAIAAGVMVLIVTAAWRGMI